MSLFSRQPQLFYFDKSRRQFLTLGGLAAAAMVLPTKSNVSAEEPAQPLHFSGVHAMAQALIDAGVQTLTHVPATMAVDVFDAFHALRGTAPVHDFNEEVAYTMAHGAALSGTRAVSILKSHGLAKAANSVLDSITLGAVAGFVALVVEDPQGRHSDNIFDAESFLRGTGLPFKKATQATLYDDMLECMLWSESLELPVALFMDTELLARETEVARKQLQPPRAVYQRDPLRHLLCPLLAAYQHQVMQARLAQRSWRDIAPPPLPAIPEGLPEKWRAPVQQFMPLFEAFRELRPQIPVVCGDTGLSSLFAFPPFDCVDNCSYYGGSLPLALGFHLGGMRQPWAVTGDYAFVAAGHLGLLAARALQAPLKVLVLNNGHAMATGGQPVADGVYDQLLSGWTPYVRRIKIPSDTQQLRAALNDAHASDRLEIISVDFHQA